MSQTSGNSSTQTITTQTIRGGAVSNEISNWILGITLIGLIVFLVWGLVRPLSEEWWKSAETAEQPATIVLGCDSDVEDENESAKDYLPILQVGYNYIQLRPGSCWTDRIGPQLGLGANKPKIWGEADGSMDVLLYLENKDEPQLIGYNPPSDFEVDERVIGVSFQNLSGRDVKVLVLVHFQ